ncbi:hypothetical protein A6R68_19963, partial [Neotoma lepida]
EAKAKALKAKKEVLKGVHSHKKKKIRTSPTFWRPKTLRLPRRPKYPRKNILERARPGETTLSWKHNLLASNSLMLGLKIDLPRGLCTSRPGLTATAQATNYTYKRRNFTPTDQLGLDAVGSGKEVAEAQDK